MTEAELDDGTRMSSVRTALSFQRTRIAGDRTVMASIRTSLSMIAFGFTIASVFRGLKEENLLGPRVPDNAPAIFGLSLILLGILVLSLAIVAEKRFMDRLHLQRQDLIRRGLLAEREAFPRSFVMLIATLLWMVGLLAFGIIATALLG
jgi:putative membrane protein